MPKKKPTATQLKKKATVLHSQLVRSRGACENCGKTTNLQCAHIISRRYSATRTDLDNAFCLCAGCHMRFTEWPVEFGSFVVDKIGNVEYATLRAKAETVTRMDWAAELERLKGLEVFA